MRSKAKPVLALLLAAGKGTRMKSDVPKVLHEVGGKPILGHVLDAVRDAGIRQAVVVVGFGERKVRSFINGRAEVVKQVPQSGTGHAVLCAQKKLSRWNGLILVVPGDAPCVRAHTLRHMIQAHEDSGASASILTAILKEPFGYGRILRRHGAVVGIREELEANETERQIKEVNSGIYLFDGKKLLACLGDLKSNNRKKEYYLTDVIESFAGKGHLVCGYLSGSENDVLGINSRVDLARAEKIMNVREIEKHQKNGVTVVSPENTFISSGVVIGKDTIIYPFSWIERGVTIGRNCQIGPFATIRKTSRIHDSVVVGCFVEVVRSNIGKGSRVKHLAYLGDARLGDNVNVGAGTITANFDGFRKQKTVIANGALIGSNTVLVAPVTVGKRARTGAGSVVLSKCHVPKGETVVGVPARLVSRKRKH